MRTNQIKILCNQVYETDDLDRADLSFNMET